MRKDSVNVKLREEGFFADVAPRVPSSASSYFFMETAFPPPLETEIFRGFIAPAVTTTTREGGITGAFIPGP